MVCRQLLVNFECFIAFVLWEVMNVSLPCVFFPACLFLIGFVLPAQHVGRPGQELFQA